MQAYDIHNAVEYGLTGKSNRMFYRHVRTLLKVASWSLCE